MRLPFRHPVRALSDVGAAAAAYNMLHSFRSKKWPTGQWTQARREVGLQSKL